MRRWVPTELLWGTVAPIGAGSPSQAAASAYEGRVGDGSSQWPGPTSSGYGESCPGSGWCLWRACGGGGGAVVPNSSGLPAKGTGCLARVAVGDYGGHAGDCSSKRPGPTSWGERESYPGGGRYLLRACRGRLLPTAWAQHLGRRGGLPRQRSVPMERLPGTIAPIGASPPPRGMENHAQVAAGAYGGHAGDGSSRRPGSTSWGDQESYPSGGWCLWRACGAWQLPRARATIWGDGESYPRGDQCLWSGCVGQ